MRLIATTSSVHMLVVNEQKGGLGEKTASFGEIIYSSTWGRNIKQMIEEERVKWSAEDGINSTSIIAKRRIGAFEKKKNRSKDHAIAIPKLTSQLCFDEEAVGLRVLCRDWRITPKPWERVRQNPSWWNGNTESRNWVHIHTLLFHFPNICHKNIPSAKRTGWAVRTENLSWAICPGTNSYLRQTIRAKYLPRTALVVRVVSCMPGPVTYALRRIPSYD